jgi:hypothetical protein
MHMPPYKPAARVAAATSCPTPEPAYVSLNVQVTALLLLLQALLLPVIGFRASAAGMAVGAASMATARAVGLCTFACVKILPGLSDWRGLSPASVHQAAAVTCRHVSHVLLVRAGSLRRVCGSWLRQAIIDWHTPLGAVNATTLRCAHASCCINYMQLQPCITGTLLVCRSCSSFWQV